MFWKLCCSYWVFSCRTVSRRQSIVKQGCSYKSDDNVVLHRQQPSCSGERGCGVPVAPSWRHRWACFLLCNPPSFSLAFNTSIMFRKPTMFTLGWKKKRAMLQLNLSRKAVKAIYMVRIGSKKNIKESFGGNNPSVGGKWPRRHNNFFPI